MVGQPSRAIVIDRNRTHARRLARVLGGAGYQVELLDGESAQLPDPPRAGEAPLLLIGEAQSRELVFQALSQAPSGYAAAIYYGQGTADEFDGTEMMAGAGLLALLGCRGPLAGRTDLEGELLWVARHLQGMPLPPLQAHLLWGAQAFGTEIANIAARDAATQRIVELCAAQLGTSRRIADGAGEVVHELITNAMYGAPVDERGKERYAHDRTASIQLPQPDRVSFRYGTDGLRLAVEVEDRFGRLHRTDLVKSLRRGASGQIKQGSGGAGIGLSVVFRASRVLQIEVEPGTRTRVTAVMDIEPRQQDADARPQRSLILSRGASLPNEGAPQPQDEPSP